MLTQKKKNNKQYEGDFVTYPFHLQLTLIVRLTFKKKRKYERHFLSKRADYSNYADLMSCFASKSGNENFRSKFPDG